MENVSQCERCRKRADANGAGSLRGIPSHVLGLLRAQVLSRLAFAACLCFSFEPGLVTDVDAPANVSECERCLNSLLRMFKQAHKRQRADEDGA